MTTIRILVLLLGPVPIVLLSLTLARWVKPDGPAARAEDNHVVSAAPSSNRRPVRRHIHSTTPNPALDTACQQTADMLRGRLGTECTLIVRPPFLVAGDMSQSELVHWYEHTIGPAARAMHHAYFRVTPDEPITVLLFSAEHSYDCYAKALYGDAEVSVYGYYKRGHRVLIMNASTGAGTAVHELTHALADFDCPAIPDWFNEGLASLHEQCRIRSDEAGLDGLENWRLPKLQEAIRNKQLRTLESLIGQDDFRERSIGLNYAQARYFCLWLQRQNLLRDFFQHWRSNQSSDPLGADAVLATLSGKSWPQIDGEFQDWVLTLSWQKPLDVAAGSVSKTTAPSATGN